MSHRMQKAGLDCYGASSKFVAELSAWYRRHPPIESTADTHPGADFVVPTGASQLPTAHRRTHTTSDIGQLLQSQLDATRHSERVELHSDVGMVTPFVEISLLCKF